MSLRRSPPQTFGCDSRLISFFVTSIFKDWAKHTPPCAELTYWAPEVCRQQLRAVHVVPESPPGLLQSGFVSRLPQFPQNQTSQQGVQVTCKAKPLDLTRQSEDTRGSAPVLT